MLMLRNMGNWENSNKCTVRVTSDGAFLFYN